MKKEDIFIILLVFLFLYLIYPMPYCHHQTPTEENITTKKIESEEELKKIPNTIKTTVRGTSMFPVIKNNSKCLCTKKRNYKAGDIVMFVGKSDGKIETILHEIIIKDSNGYYTKGLNNDFIDPKIRKENIICSVPEIPRYQKLLSRFAIF